MYINVVLCLGYVWWSFTGLIKILLLASKLAFISLLLFVAAVGLVVHGWGALSGLCRF